MSQEHTIASQWINAVNAHDPAAIRALLDDEFIWELGGSSTSGAEISAEAWRMWFVGFPDFSFETLRVVSEGEIVVSQLRMRGTHNGEFQFRGTKSLEKPLPPTGRAFDLPGCAVHEVRHGKITHLWAYWDTATLLTQLGLLPIR